MNRYRSQVREVINRNTVVSRALEQGFNAFLPVYDGGVDFILYRESDGAIRKVQLKGRCMEQASGIAMRSAPARKDILSLSQPPYRAATPQQRLFLNGLVVAFEPGTQNRAQLRLMCCCGLPCGRCGPSLI
jgi:hypothetical protein